MQICLDPYCIEFIVTQLNRFRIQITRLLAKMIFVRHQNELNSSTKILIPTLYANKRYMMLSSIGKEYLNGQFCSGETPEGKVPTNFTLSPVKFYIMQL